MVKVPRGAVLDKSGNILAPQVAKASSGGERSELPDQRFIQQESYSAEIPYSELSFGYLTGSKSF